MRILVTGGNGQVAYALKKVSEKQELDLIVLDRIELNIINNKSITNAFEKFNPDILINTAAYTSVDKAETEKKLAYEVNAKGAALLATECASNSIPMLHISTDYVFDGLKLGSYDENDIVNPLSVYGRSKLEGEDAVRNLLKEHIILRTSWVFGLHGNNFVKSMLRLASEHDCLNVVDDQVGGPTSANSIAQVLLALVQQYKNKGNLSWGTYHFCQKPYASWYEFSEVIFDKAYQRGLINRKMKVKAINSNGYPMEAPRPLNSRLNTSKLRKIISNYNEEWLNDLEDVLEFVEIEYREE